VNDGGVKDLRHIGGFKKCWGNSSPSGQCWKCFNVVEWVCE